jgi:uncharacterized membrane protein
MSDLSEMSDIKFQLGGNKGTSGAFEALNRKTGGHGIRAVISIIVGLIGGYLIARGFVWKKIEQKLKKKGTAIKFMAKLIAAIPTIALSGGIIAVIFFFASFFFQIMGEFAIAGQGGTYR